MAKNLTFKERWEIPIYNDPAQINNGVVVVDEEKCTGCGLCQMACPAGALEIAAKKSRMVTHVFNECMACGDCVAICPEKAINLRKGYAYKGYYKTLDQKDLKPPRL